jgi:hypothetical protein
MQRHYQTGTGCDVCSDCEQCPLQECKYEHEPEKYPGYFNTMAAREKLVKRLPAIRRNRQYKEDRQRLRHLMSIPPEGYGRTAARRRLTPFAKAYLDDLNKKRGSYKHRREAGVWMGILSAVRKFALKYPLGKKQPMPVSIAFEEIVYKKPQARFILRGYYQTNKNGLTILLEDASTEAPYEIERMVMRCIDDDNDNEIVKRVLIFNRHSNWGEWKICNLASKNTQ